MRVSVNEQCCYRNADASEQACECKSVTCVRATVRAPAGENDSTPFDQSDCRTRCHCGVHTRRRTRLTPRCCLRVSSTGRADHQLAAGVQVVRHATRQRARAADLRGSGKKFLNAGVKGSFRVRVNHVRCSVLPLSVVPSKVESIAHFLRGAIG